MVCSQSGVSQPAYSLNKARRARTRKNKGPGFQNKKKTIVQWLICTRRNAGKKQQIKEFNGSSRGKSGAWERLLYSKWRMDVIGQPRRRGSAACFHCALNYASLSFHQPHTGRQIKNTSAEVLPSRLSRRWEDKSRSGRFVTRSTTQQVRCINMSVNEIILIPSATDG